MARLTALLFAALLLPACLRVSPDALPSDDSGALPEPSTGTPGGTSVSPGHYTILDHAEECAEAGLGYLPQFDCINDAVPIPTTNAGEEISSHKVEQKCDRPAILPLGGDDGQCVPYSRIGRLKGLDAQGNEIPEADWVFICRRYEMPENELDPVFADVAMIGHNSENGATCFMQGFPHDHGTDRPLRLPPPHEANADTPEGAMSAEEFWLHPKDIAGIRCLTCHDSDPFIHTPYVDQVTMNVDGKEEAVVPVASPSDRDLPYWIIGSRFFDAWPDPTHITPEGNSCVACHRMGTETTCGQLAAKLTGKVKVDYRSALYSTYPHNTTMPPGSSASMTQEEWTLAYRADVDEILDCCADPTQFQCNLQVSGSIQARELKEAAGTDGDTAD